MKLLKNILIAGVLCAAAALLYSVGLFAWMSSVSSGTSLPLYDRESAALLVIDIQEGITGKLAARKGFVEQAGPFIEKVNRSIRKASALGMPVIYIRQENTNWLINRGTGGTLGKGTPGTAVDSRVHLVSETVFTKEKMDAFSNPALDQYLREHRINKLVVTGLDTAYCVDRTSRAALKRGYGVTVIRDAVISEDPARNEKMLKRYAAEGISLTTIGDWELTTQGSGEKPKIDY